MSLKVNDLARHINSLVIFSLKPPPDTNADMAKGHIILCGTRGIAYIILLPLSFLLSQLLTDHVTHSDKLRLRTGPSYISPQSMRSVSVHT